MIGVENDNFKLLAKAAQALRETPYLPLGSKGTLHGIAWEVIGFLRRKSTSEGVDYHWSEYLLFNAEQGFAWLVEDQGHWNYTRTLSNPPSVSRDARSFKRNGQAFRLFNRGQAEITYVVGEFYWRVAVGETCKVDDYVCPPLLLSREVSNKEASWSQGEYLAADTLVAAFSLSVPQLKRQGIYANQPNPLIERHRGAQGAIGALTACRGNGTDGAHDAGIFPEESGAGVTGTAQHRCREQLAGVNHDAG